MNAMAIFLKRLPHGQGLSVPARATSGSSGMDLPAAIVDPVVIAPGKREIIPTGFCFEIPLGYEVQVRSRSGLAAKNGIMVLNSPGTIDADYRGEIKVILINLGQESFTVKRGDRIAQAIPAAVSVELGFLEIADIGVTARGIGGFGSTGL